MKSVLRKLKSINLELIEDIYITRSRVDVRKLSDLDIFILGTIYILDSFIEDNTLYVVFRDKELSFDDIRAELAEFVDSYETISELRSLRSLISKALREINNYDEVVRNKYEELAEFVKEETAYLIEKFEQE